MHPCVYYSSIYKAKMWMQLKCPWMDEGQRCGMCTYTMLYYSATKNDICENTVDLEGVVLSEIS